MIHRVYYNVKRFVPYRLLIALRRAIIRRQRVHYKHIWPIIEQAGKPPSPWNGWPEGKQFALVLTHDVESEKGLQRCLKLAQLDEQLGFRAAFNFVPEKYDIPAELLTNLRNLGFELGVHGLNHDGKLFAAPKIFHQRALRINQYLKDWNAVGFRSPSMHHNLKWIHQLDIEYDASTTDTDPFEPQSCSLGTVFPFIVTNEISKHSYVELPYTLPQDFTLFALLQEKTIDIWKTKLDWIVQHGGMVLLNTHPDYMTFDNEEPGDCQYRSQLYEQLLQYIRNKYQDRYWHVLPRDLARFWAQNSRNEFATPQWTGPKQWLCPSCMRIANGAGK